ncbi:hypothetical protein RP20_CCG021372 [Aedes albopictus]|nr:hypothetical protein RP20_CCG021372 [Aedes albopictus]
MKHIEDAFQTGDLQLAQTLFQSEWDRTANPAQIYYQVIRDGLVASFRYLESSGLCPRGWDSFRYCSNALLELDAKNVSISEEMEWLVMYKLSSYGLKNLCGDWDTVKPESYWIDSIDLVVRWVQELRSRPRWYDFLDVDDRVMFRLRMIHNHLFFVKDNPALRGVPLKEMIFCLAIFVRIHDEIPGHEVYRVVINKRNVMQFLLAIVGRLKAIKNASESIKCRRSSVLKKLRKTYRRVKQMYSVFKIMSCVQIYREIKDGDFRRCNASVTVAAIKRFNQICGEAIKNTTDTPNISEKLNKLLPDVLTDSIMLNSKYRNLSSHGIPLSHLFVRDFDQIYYYQRLSDFIYITAVSFYAVCIYLLHDCTRYMYRMMRRCRSIDDLRSLVRYAGGNKIRFLQEDMFRKVEKYLATIQNRLNETNPDDLPDNQRADYEDLLDNCKSKVEVIERLRDSHRNNLMDTAEVMAFTNVSITALHRLLDSKLTDRSSGDFFDTMFADWKILTTQSMDSLEFNAVIMQSYIHRYLELDHDSTEQWRYRERTRQILDQFTSDRDLDSSTRTTLEETLHQSLSKVRNGYYQNIFALDSKAQAIIQSLKRSITGPKTSKDFKSRNNQFKSKLDALHQQDEQELNAAFQKLILNLANSFKRNGCETIDKLISNHSSIPLKDRLAIEYWQLQVMEMLYSSGYFGDNFSLLTRSVPMIWGKSYRNYLAHDSLSYDLLTSSGMHKILINAFVLAFVCEDLNIFTKSPKYNLDGLAVPETESFKYLELQAELLENLKHCNIPEVGSCLTRRAEIGGRYLMPLGHLLRPKYFALPGIISHERFQQDQIQAISVVLKPLFPTVEKILTVSKINYAVNLNLLQFNASALVPEQIQQFQLLQPGLMAPCVGVVLPHLVNTNNFDLLETLVDRYAGSNLKAISLMSVSHTETGRNFLQTHYNLPLSIIGELTDQELNELFTEEYPASDYELGIAVARNDLRLFTHIVESCYRTENSVVEEADLLEVMESCCCHGRTEMVRCLLESGMLQCELFAMSGYLTLAIARRRWKVVDLLLENGAYAWLDDGVNVLSIISEGNFKMLRKVLVEPVPDHLTEKFVDWVVRLGNKRLLMGLKRIGVDIWKYSEVLTSATLNEDPEVLEYVESRLLPPEEELSNQELRFWFKLLNDLKLLMIISIDSDFMPSIMSKNNIAQRWVERVHELLRTNDDHFAESFHFEDPSGLFCSVLPDSYFRVFEDEFRQVVEKCDKLVGMMQSLPVELTVSKTTIFIEFCSPYEKIGTIVDLTLLSTAKHSEVQNDRTTIITEYSDHIADVISMGLRNYLLRYRHMIAATAIISDISDESYQKFFYLQIDSSSCIAKQSPRDNFNLSYLFNRPNQSSILHYITPNASHQTIEILLRLGTNPSIANKRLQTPFRTVLAQPFPIQLIRLMYRYSNKLHHYGEHLFNLKDHDGFTPLHAAVGTNNYEVVKFLLENGADPAQADQTGEAATLCYAILNRNVRVVELLLRHSPHLVHEYNQTAKQTRALETAVKINHDHIVRLLLERGANPNHRNRERCTVVKYAIEREAVESLEVLLEFGLNSEVTVDDIDVDGLGSTALQFAIEVGACPEIRRHLVLYSLKRRMLDIGKLRIKLGL